MMLEWSCFAAIWIEYQPHKMDCLSIMCIHYPACHVYSTHVYACLVATSCMYKHEVETGIITSEHKDENKFLVEYISSYGPRICKNKQEVVMYLLLS